MLRALIVSVAYLLFVPVSTRAAIMGDLKWNLRENAEDRFGSNEAYVRP